MTVPEKSSSTRRVPTLRTKRGQATILFLLLIAHLLFKPWIEERFQVSLPGFTESTATHPADERNPFPPVGTAVPTPADVSTPEPPRDRSAAATHEPSNASNGATVQQPTPQDRSPPPAGSSNPAATGAELGQLKDAGNNVFVSTAGLRYKTGSADGHRLNHLWQHLEDDPDKTIHGVFTGNRDDVLRLIDEAWVLAQKRGPPQVRKEEEPERTVYTIDLRKKIGYVGGEVGQRKDHPACTKLRLVLEGQDVITAFPVDR